MANLQTHNAFIYVFSIDFWKFTRLYFFLICLHDSIRIPMPQTYGIFLKPHVISKYNTSTRKASVTYFVSIYYSQPPYLFPANTHIPFNITIAAAQAKLCPHTSNSPAHSTPHTPHTPSHQKGSFPCIPSASINFNKANSQGHFNFIHHYSFQG